MIALRCTMANKLLITVMHFLCNTYSFSILFTSILQAADGRARFKNVNFVVSYCVL